MTKKKAIIALGLLVMAAVTIGFFAVRGEVERTYRFVSVTRGNVESTVSATGRLGAVSTVQVGTQVSGQLLAVNADFNDRVSKGQVIARIDATLLEQQVREAEANLERAVADLAQKEYALEQAKTLYDRQIVTEGEYRSAVYNHTVSKANLVSAEAGLDRARRNLEYSVIYAPIDGIVVERNVEPGQTVAASLSAPQLFLIAEDLTNMQILVSVDESDIGRIEEGQRARFTVQAYADRTFEGTVRQVRLQSTTSESVVNYTVVVGVTNPDGTLLPGMTATVAFVLDSAEDVLLVPNAALRFSASAGMQAEVRERMAGNAAQLWYVDAAGLLAVARVRTGLTDGQNTTITGGPQVVEGLQVIASVVESGSSVTAAAASNPFQQQGATGGRGRGGF
jgi:HlyD family secretion protein